MDSNDVPHMAPDILEEKKRRCLAEAKRVRTHKIAEAFAALKDVLPIPLKPKLCRLDTLHLTMNYITSLQEMIESNEEPSPHQFVQSLSNGLSLNAKITLGGLIQNQPLQHVPIQPHPQTSDFFSTSIPSELPPQYHYASNQIQSSQLAPVPSHLSSVPPPNSSPSFSTSNPSDSPPDYRYDFYKYM